MSHLKLESYDSPRFALFEAHLGVVTVSLFEHADSLDATYRLPLTQLELEVMLAYVSDPLHSPPLSFFKDPEALCGAVSGDKIQIVFSGAPMPVEMGGRYRPVTLDRNQQRQLVRFLRQQLRGCRPSESSPAPSFGLSKSNPNF